ncbi:MAG: glyoxalase/bleomycin resistance/extradiol dioxygenase family protein [Hyphomicrobiales bacterium]|nr:glyoxalase/bleomycin resistance/extradiol dioxygenase family protein [Hyphomicrobiales bacterium]
MNGRAIPVLPVRSTHQTKRFYERLGFRDVGHPDWSHDYLIVRAGDVELHFFRWPDLEPESSAALCHIRVENADELHGMWSPLGLPQEGVPRLTPVADTPWGVRQFALVDPDGNCISCGHPREARSAHDGGPELRGIPHPAFP